MAITKEQIHAAADQIAASGETPTLANVRKALGGGSFTTISDAMNEWKAKQQKPSVTTKESTPEAISKRLNELGGDLWAYAVELANSRLSAEREGLEAARAKMQAEQQEAATIADQLSEELETLKDRFARVHAELETANETINRLEQTNANLTRDMAISSAKAEETVNRINDLKDETVQLRNDYLEELDYLKKTHAENLAKLAESMQQKNEAIENATLETINNKEKAARLEGENAALIAQNAALLATLQPVAKAKTQRKPKKANAIKTSAAGADPGDEMPSKVAA